MFLIFSRAPRYRELYELLIDALEVEAAVDLPSVKVTSADSDAAIEKKQMDVDIAVGGAVEVPYEIKSRKKGVADNKVEKLWMATALLILDTMSQSLLVDKSVLKVMKVADSVHS